MKSIDLAIHKAALDYCDRLIANGADRDEAMLTVMLALAAEAITVGDAARVTAEDFCKIVTTLYAHAEAVRAELEE